MICITVGLILIAGCVQSTPVAVQTPTTVVVTSTPAEATQTPGTSPTAQPPTPVPPSTTPTTPPPTVHPSATPPPPTISLPPPPEAYEDRRDAVSLLASYVNAINRKEYDRAWSYWETPPNPSLAAFEEGFADTASVFLAVSPPTWIDAGAGNFFTSIPTMLIATHTDGSQHSYVGCYVAHAINPGMLATPTAVEEWSLRSATVHAAPGNSTDATLLANACDPAPDLSYEDRRNPIALLASYFNAINRKEYDRAWSYWENPPNLSLADFKQGYADTAAMLLVVGPPAWIGAAAGSMFTSVPTLLVATHTDSSRHVYVGCYAAHAVNPGMLPTPTAEENWSLWDATIREAPGNSTDATQLAQPCPAP